MKKRPSLSAALVATLVLVAYVLGISTTSLDTVLLAQSGSQDPVTDASVKQLVDAHTRLADKFLQIAKKETRKAFDIMAAQVAQQSKAGTLEQFRDLARMSLSLFEFGNQPAFLGLGLRARLEVLEAGDEKHIHAKLGPKLDQCYVRNMEALNKTIRELLSKVMAWK